MSKRDTLQKIMNIGAGLAGAYFVGIAIAGAVKRKREQQAQGAQGVGATKKFYVYAGYYENYISSKPMPAPYVLRRTCRTIETAIRYAESFDDTVIFCDNVKNDLPDYIYDVLEDTDYFKY